MPDDQNAAERLDPSVLGEQVGDTGRPAEGFPPDEPLAVDDPSILEQGVVARDDVQSRTERLVDPDDLGSDEGRAGPALIATDDIGTDDIATDDDVRRGDRRLVADEADTEETAAEAAAVRREESGPPGRP